MLNIIELTRERIREISDAEIYNKADDDMVARWFKTESENIFASIGSEETNRLFSYEKCEVAPDFLGFLENYKDISERLPKDFIIIDIGCYMAFQADYYKNFKDYIGVEPQTPLKYRLRQNNAEYYEQTAQQFVANTLPVLIENGLDLDKTFAVCSAVPDEEARKLVAETFKYYRVAYPGEDDIERFPA